MSRACQDRCALLWLFFFQYWATFFGLRVLLDGLDLTASCDHTSTVCKCPILRVGVLVWRARVCILSRLMAATIARHASSDVFAFIPLNLSQSPFASEPGHKMPRLCFAEATA